MDYPALQIHPQLQQAARFAPGFSAGRKNLWLIRLLLKLTPSPKFPRGVRVENIRVPRPGEKKGVRLRIYRPESAAPRAPVLVWLHGGGYVMGTSEMDDARCAGYAARAGIRVVSVDYRLAPEHPFPSGLEDAYAAVQWVWSQEQAAGADAARIAVGGASAGGGLAAATAQLAHDRGEIPLAFQLLVYPMLDDRTSFRADPVPENRIAWSHANNRFGWNAYLNGRGGADEALPYAVPARRADLSGLPPAWIGVGTADIFHQEGAAYAERLKACGVHCEFESVPGAFHGFDAFGQAVPVVRDFREAMFAAIQRGLAESSASG